MTTIDKSFHVLEVLAEHPGGQMAALEPATGIPKSTLYRLLRNLAVDGLVTQDPSGGWHLGQRMFALAARTFHLVGPGEAQRRVLIALARKVHLTVHLSVLRGGQLVYVDKLEADTPFKMRSSAGRIQPIHSSAIGKSVLAMVEEGQARAMLDAAPLERFTARTLTDVAAVMRQLPAVRARGFATDDEEDEQGTRAIGAAFPGGDGRPAGGNSVVAPTFVVSMIALAQHSGALPEATAAMGRIYGARAETAGAVGPRA